MSHMLHKSFEIIETKALDDETPGTFEAIVSVFGNVDRNGDRVAATAFDDTLAEWSEKGKPIPILFDHRKDDAWAHIGYANPQDVRPVPGRGLYAKGVLDVKENPLAAQVYRLMKRGSLSEFSFGYRVPPGGEKRAKDGAYDLNKIDLKEISATLTGANPDTELLSVKSELERSDLERRMDAMEARMAAFEEKSTPIFDRGGWVVPATTMTNTTGSGAEIVTKEDPSDGPDVPADESEDADTAADTEEKSIDPGLVVMKKQLERFKKLVSDEEENQAA